MRRIAAIVAAVILLLVVAQLALPGIAANRIRDKLKGNGRVISVTVSAFPAIELLWHDADKVVVRMANYHSGTSHLSSLLDQSANLGTLDASAQVLTSGLLTIHNARMHKSGNTLTGTAQVQEADLRRAIPILQSVTPIASPNGTLTLEGRASLFGFTATVPVTVAARDGKIVAAPDVPLGGFATITLFNDPHVYVRSVSAAAVAGGFRVQARADLK